MVEKFANLGEVAHALVGIRDQLSLHKLVFGGAVAIGVTAAGVLYSKLDAVEDSTARIETKLESIEAQLDRIALDMGDIKQLVQTAGFHPASRLLKNPVAACAAA